MTPGYLTELEVNRFKDLVLKKTGIELTYEEAADQAFRLIRLFEIITRPMRQKVIEINSKSGNVV
jgi:hypothetical protein